MEVRPGGDAARPAPAPLPVVVVRIAERRYAVPLDLVTEVVRATAIVAAAGAQEGVIGFLDLRGQTVPVIDLTSSLGLPPREHDIDPGDRFVVATRDGASVALLVEDVEGIVEADAAAEWIELPGLPAIAYTRDARAQLDSLLLPVLTLSAADVPDPLEAPTSGASA